ncbi:MAG TPA: 16S rRNA pseudouridine(516) synthase, partial [Alcanivorax sp.]|nr:16S rRNA pseudouridine(516) synthase [Alcanivorax sp.]
VTVTGEDGAPRTGLKANSSVAPGECVRLDGAVLTLPGERYLMLHKPAGRVCALEDALPTVIDLIPAEQRRGLRIVGRLDRDTTGLLLLTTDGQWAHRLMSPRHHCAKRYRVTTAEPLDDTQLTRLRDGVVLHDDPAPTRPAEARALSDTELLLTISEGRYHQVKRMLAAVGNRVVALHREAVGHIELDPDLPAGAWRPLTDAEIG